MHNWIAKRFKFKFSKPEMIPLNVFERYDIRAKVYEETRPRGHVGHIIELELFVETADKWITFGELNDTMLHDAIIVLQETQEFIGKVNGVTLLPTVRMWKGAYEFDVRKGTFRNVDDPQDCIVTERVA